MNLVLILLTAIKIDTYEIFIEGIHNLTERFFTGACGLAF